VHYKAGAAENKMNTPTNNGGVPTGRKGPEGEGKDQAPQSKGAGDTDQRGPLAELNRAIRGIQELHRWQGVLLDGAAAQMAVLLGQAKPGLEKQDAP
jgi:hypothetical protein